MPRMRENTPKYNYLHNYTINTYDFPNNIITIMYVRLFTDQSILLIAKCLTINLSKCFDKSTWPIDLKSEL